MINLLLRFPCQAIKAFISAIPIKNPYIIYEMLYQCINPKKAAESRMMALSLAFLFFKMI
jgi:hypothetical protein